MIVGCMRSCPNLEAPDVKRRRVIGEDDSKSSKPPPKRCPTNQVTTVPSVTSFPNSRRSLEVDPFTEENEFTRSQALYFAWREVEGRMPVETFSLSFDESLEIEQIRIAGIDSIFNYVQRKELSQSTLHLATHYANRLFYYYCVEKASDDLPHQCLFTAVAAALRTAVKIQERWEHAEPFRINPDQLWNIAKIGNADYPVEKSVALLNQMERLHLRILQHEPVHVPLASDFFEQYLTIGGWPQVSVVEYRQLGQFLLALSLFSTGRNNALSGVMPSKLAAAALVLAVKIINADQSGPAYEFWTQKLEIFTQYALKDLQPTVHSLSRLLRRRQSKVKSEVFSSMFPIWSKYSWS